MNAKEINGGAWTFRKEMIYMSNFPHTPPQFIALVLTHQVPISIAIILTSFILAFSTFIRAFLSFIFDLAWTRFVTSTRIYTLWRDFNFDSQKLSKMRRERATKWKEDAKKAKQERTREKLKKVEAKKRDLKEQELKRNRGPKSAV